MKKQEIKYDEITENICPFMSRMNDTSGLCIIQCLRDKCMAWGIVAIEYIQDQDGVADEYKIYGCKLIGETEK